MLFSITSKTYDSHIRISNPVSPTPYWHGYTHAHHSFDRVRSACSGFYEPELIDLPWPADESLDVLRPQQGNDGVGDVTIEAEIVCDAGVDYVVCEYQSENERRKEKQQPTGQQSHPEQLEEQKKQRLCNQIGLPKSSRTTDASTIGIYSEKLGVLSSKEHSIVVASVYTCGAYSGCELLVLGHWTRIPSRLQALDPRSVFCARAIGKAKEKANGDWLLCGPATGDVDALSELSSGEEDSG